MQKLLFEDITSASGQLEEVRVKDYLKRGQRPKLEKQQWQDGQIEMLGMVPWGNCVLCGGKFKKRKRRICCSADCHDKYKRWKKLGILERYNPKTGSVSPRIIKCKGCGKEFETNVHGKKWLCSAECRRKAVVVSNVRWGRKYYSSSPEKYLRKRWLDIGNEVSKHKRSVNEFTLAASDLFDKWVSQKGLCALSGLPMTHAMGEGIKRTNISVDRIDNLKGYTKDNTRLVCWIVNVMRHKMGDEELLMWCAAIIEFNGIKSIEIPVDE
jgi:hypothetical protein